MRRQGSSKIADWLQRRQGSGRIPGFAVLCALALSFAGGIANAQPIADQGEVIAAPRGSAVQPLLIPFATNQLGFDTEITISNTSQDTSGSTPQSGTCTLYFYGVGAPTPANVTLASIAAGRQQVVYLSSYAPGFQGYVIANCNFPLARANARLTYNAGQANGRTEAQDAQLLTLPRSSSGTRSLLIPFVTNQLGFDTGIAIANTSADPFGANGATRTSGTCTLSFYGVGAPTPSTGVADPLGAVAAGTTHAFLLSQVAPGFQGYLIISCPFATASGFAFTAFNLTQNNAILLGETPEQITSPRSSTPQPLLYYFESNVSGTDTAIVIANTSLDSLGAAGSSTVTPGSGTCTLNFYGSGAPVSPVVTPNIPAGTVYTAVLSTIAPAFQGYMTATCPFPQARGFAYVKTPVNANSWSETPEVIQTPRNSAASSSLLFSKTTNWFPDDTGISISNTSLDSFGTTSGSGACTISYFGSMIGGGNTPSPQTSTSIPPGSQLTFTLSGGNSSQGIAGAPGFRGYVIADCGFPLARGVAFLSGLPAGVPTISTTTLPSVEVGSPYSQTLALSNGAPPFTWAATGTPPAGLTLNSATGVIAGTPTQVGPSSFNVSVTDSEGYVSYPQPLSINVLPALTITTTSLTSGVANAPYSQTLQATGGSLPYIWSLFSGSPPSGVTVSAGGVISGTPTATGSFQFTVKLTDSLSYTATQILTLQVGGPLVSSVQNAADRSLAPVAPGSLSYLLGQALAGTTVTLPTTSGGVTVLLPTTLGSVTVQVNGFPAPLAAVSATQILFQVPYELTGLSSATAVVNNNGILSNPITFSLFPAAAGIFRNASGQASVTNQDSSVNSTSNGAPVGSTVSALLTGVGVVNPPVTDGVSTPASPPSPALNIESVTVAGLPATVTFAGLAPGQTAGVGVVSFNIPALASGTYPLVVTAAGRASLSAPITVSAPALPTPPVLSSLSPNSSPLNGPSISLAITGQNFNAGSSISWIPRNAGAPTGGISATLAAAGQLTATIPVSLLTSAGIVDVTVVDPSGVRTDSLPFTITSSATLTSVAPASAVAGGPAVPLTLAGQGFVSGSTVSFTGTDGVITSLGQALGTANQLTATIPVTLLTTAGQVRLTVVSPGAAQSNPINFTILPALISATPSTLPYGSPATQVTLAGSNFAAGSLVTWTTPDGRNIRISGSTIQAAQLAATLPSALLTTAGTAQIAILDPSGLTSSRLAFNITSPLSATSLAPNTASAGSAATTLNVNGPAFTAGSSVAWTAPNGQVTLIPANLVSAAQLAATISPALLTTAGTAQVAIVNGSSVLSNQLPFAITPFTITSLSPSSVAVYNSATVLTITGVNISGAASVAWTPPGGQVQYLAPTLINATTATVTVPASLLTSAGAAQVALIDSNGAPSNPLSFTVNALSPLTLQTTTLSLTVGGAGSLNASGGNTIGPYTWQLAAGSPALPAFANLSSAGVLSLTGASTPGTYAFSAQVADVDGSTAVQSITLTVSAAPPPPPAPPTTPSLTASPGAVTFSAPSNGAAACQNVTLQYRTSSGGAPSFSTSTTVNQGTGWLTVSPPSGSLPFSSTSGTQSVYQGTASVCASPANIAAGSVFTGAINATVNGSFAQVTVTLNVTPGANSVLTASPGLLSFTYQQGDAAAPAGQVVSVFSTPAGGTFTAAASTTSGGNWLGISSTGGTAPSNFTATANITGLNPGSYGGKITLTPAVGPAIVVSANLTVTAKPAGPTLSVSGTSQSFTLNQSSPLSSGQITVSNTGSGTLQFTASASPTTGNWLQVVGGGTGSATHSSSGAVAFTVSPAALPAGVYSGQLTVQDSNSSANAVVAITLAVTQVQQSLLLSQSGLTFSASTGATSAAPQSFTVISQGQGVLSWQTSAQYVGSAGAGWLSVTPPSGSSPGGQGTPVAVTVNPRGLAAGDYYASINVTAPDAVNSPQIVSVLLHVLGSGTAGPGVTFSSGGLTFGGPSGSAAQQQSITMFNPAQTPQNFTTAVSTGSGTNWLTVTPSTGALTPGSNNLTVQADFTNLASGTQIGTVKVGFDDGSVGTIQVLALSYGQNGSAIGGLQPRAGCSVIAVSPNFTHPLALTSATVAQAQLVQMKIVDNCNNPVTQGSGGVAQVTFSNKDSALNLHDVGGGIWEGTWTPANATASAVLQVLASTSSGIKQLYGSASLTVAVLPAAANSAALPQGAVNAAATQGTPNIVAPGSYVAIFGTGMASTGTPTGTTVPLGTNLNDTQLLLGDLSLPLSYASPTQVNGLIPEHLNPNTSYQLIVQRGSTQSVPIPITVAALQPGIYSVDSSGTGQGAIQIAGTTLLAAPASYPVASGQPARRGADYLTIYGTGLGDVQGTKGESAPADGFAAALPTIYQTKNTVTVTVGGVNAPVLFAGLTPTLVALYQVNVQVPAGAPAGDAVPVVITVTDQNGNTVQSNTVTVALQ